MIYYLATPYTKYAQGTEEAYREACRNAAILMQSGLKVFCPIAHSHPIAKHGNLNALDHDFWLEQDSPWLQACDALIVCQMDGWRNSRGMAWEMDEFVEAGKTIYFMTPGIVPAELLEGE